MIPRRRHPKDGEDGRREGRGEGAKRNAHERHHAGPRDGDPIDKHSTISPRFNEEFQVILADRPYRDQIELN
jgi:hypothetical protein